jgi:hypothetical protein
MEQDEMRIIWAAGVEWMIKNGKTISRFTDQRETMGRGDQESLLVPMKQTGPMCFRGDQAAFGLIGVRRWQHNKAQPRVESGLLYKTVWSPV